MGNLDKTEVFRPVNTGAGYLYILDNTLNVRIHKLDAHAPMGRLSSTETPEIVLNSSIASRHHGEFYEINGNYIYRDLHSTNGTYINNIKLVPKDNDVYANHPMTDGDVIRIDHGDLIHPHPDANLMIFSTSCPPDMTWERLKLNPQDDSEICIGRGGTNTDIQLTNKLVSQNHAIFRNWNNAWYIEDCNSTNGVYLNNVRIEHPCKLNLLDVVKIADYYFIFVGNQLIYNTVKGNNKLVIRINKRTAWNHFKRLTLLQDINLSVDEGDMCLILGGSGAGKTTFINAVMGYEKAEGTILHEGQDVYKDYEAVKYQIGFVPQQDLLRENDEVFATLDSAAIMKLPRKTTEEERHRRIDQLLEQFGLEREKYSLVKKLSGGQRKRLSIAVEFVSNPSLFFLDEPDSGLDGIMARSLMESLRKIADQRKIVMVITHSPDRVADLFDKVIVLAKSAVDNCGHLAFYGTIDEALAFFEVSSVEQIVRRINRADEGGEGLSDFYIQRFQAMMER